MMRDLSDATPSFFKYQFASTVGGRARGVCACCVERSASSAAAVQPRSSLSRSRLCSAAVMADGFGSLGASTAGVSAASGVAAPIDATSAAPPIDATSVAPPINGTNVAGPIDATSVTAIDVGVSASRADPC